MTERDMVRLDNVHPDLKRVFLLAAERVPMCVIQGVRTREECMVNWGKGRTAGQCAVWRIPAKYAQPKAAKVTTLKNPFSSMHCVQDDGYGHAVDAGPVPLVWSNIEGFKAIAAAMLDAAKELGVRIEWGGSWKKFKDFPHFELVS